MDQGKSVYRPHSYGPLVFRVISLVWLLPIIDHIMNPDLLDQKPEGVAGTLNLIVFSLIGFIGFFIAGKPPKKRHTFFELGLFQNEKGKPTLYRSYEDVVLVECYYRKHRGDERTYHYYYLVFWFSDASYAEIRIQNHQEKLHAIWKQLVSSNPYLNQRLAAIKGDYPSEQLYRDLTQW